MISFEYAQIGTFLLRHPNSVAHILLGIIGFICIVASHGAPELLAAGILIFIAVGMYPVYNFTGLGSSRFATSLLYFLDFAAFVSSLAALIVNSIHSHTFWVVWTAISLPLIIGCALGILASAPASSRHTTAVTTSSTAGGPGVTSVLKLVLREGQASIVYYHEGKGADIWENFTSYRIVYGPGKFELKSNEWCHSFLWTHPWFRPGRYPTVGFILSTLEDHIYAKMDGLRTTDNKSVYLDVYIFFRLVDIDKMVRNHTDPIYAFRGVAREDIFRFVASKNFSEFLRTRGNLCSLSEFTTLIKYAESVGFAISKVTCIDYKDKPRVWKETSGGNERHRKEKAKLHGANKEDDESNPHEY